MFETLKKRAAAWWKKPEHELTLIMPALQRLRQSLREAEDMQPLDGIVHFFNRVSYIQDIGRVAKLIEMLKEVSYGQYDELLRKLGELDAHLQNAGREEFGWNRTRRYETVTPDNVYLGNIYGLFTKTVSYWKSQQDAPRGEWEGTGWASYCRGMNNYDVVSRQAREFMESHIGPMIELIGWLESYSLEIDD